MAAVKDVDPLSTTCLLDISPIDSLLSPRPFSTTARHLRLIVTTAVVILCGVGCSRTSPAAPTPPSGTFSVSGSVRERLSQTPASSSEIFFQGPTNASVKVAADGSYNISGLLPGDYDVVIVGPTHVRHETRNLSLLESQQLSFSVIQWGSTSFGVPYDEEFQRFFHQLARVRRGIADLRKWVIKPSELYLVEGTVPTEQFDLVSTELDWLNQHVVPALWCNWIGSLKITRGPESSADVDGRIVVRPNWDEGSTGSMGQIQVRSGRIAVNVFGPTRNRLQTREEIRGALAHELFHVAGAFHVCGGDLGDNPFGFSRDNCPFPGSLMANLGDLPFTPSPQDRLASCLVYNADTVPGNRYPDTNPYYAGRE